MPILPAIKPRPSVAVLWLTILFCVAPAFAAVEEDEDEPQYAPGLVATYATGTEAKAVRVDDDVQFVWRGAAPDLRLPAGPFSAAWQGRLFTMTPGEYRFHVYAGGGYVELKLNDRVLLRFAAGEPAWHVSEPIKLGYAYSPIVLTFRQSVDEAQLRLNWSGPQFAVEPIPERHLFHEPKQSPPRTFEQGRDLVRALRCAACHELSDRSVPIPAPALTHLRGNLGVAWLNAHLSADGRRGEDPSAEPFRRMPYFALAEGDAAAIAAFLFDASAQSPAVKVPQAKEPPPPATAATDKRKKPKPRTAPSVRQGELLARGVGCLACHAIGKLGMSGPFGGGDLTAIAAKRPPEFFVRWLENPTAVNADHRMPAFKLTELERADLAVYLMTLGSATKPTPGENSSDDFILRGKELVTRHRCGACHRLPGTSAKPAVAISRPFSNASELGCLAEPDAAKHRPGYRLDEGRRKAVVEYLARVVPAGPNDKPPLDGRFVLAERNCTACHARGLGAGLADDAPQITAVDAELLPVQAALLPPSLNGVGDKLTDESLAAAIALKREPLRPWLRVRMPKFELADDELAALKSYLVDHDRIPDLPAARETESEETAQRLAARRLVTADGFGCTSCHKIGNSEPQGITNLAAHGTDLTLIGDRIRKPWFDRWVRNPPRIIPRMEMPAIQLPVKGVLHDDVNEQLAAVWKVLNEPGFNPPLPNPVRIVRARNVPGLKERANVLSDVFVVEGKTYVSPIVIGLPNRHNILFDLETNRLAAWWTGDTALERTKGKSWYWEPGGAMVVSIDGAPTADGELAARGESDAFRLAAVGQNIARLDKVAYVENGATFSYRLTLSDSRVLRGRQSFESLPSDDADPSATGFRRTIEIEELPPEVDVRALPIEVGESRWPGRPRAVVKTTTGDGVTRFVIDYRVNLPIDTFPTEVPVAPPPPSVKLDVVPGFEAVQLPLTPSEMPTGLAWKRDGTLVVASLKGRVFTAKDADGDGLEDTLQPISHDLATPYGVAVAEENGREVIDVIEKTDLMRLHDDDGDGFCERAEVVASGWGHTDDYHDWAVGLPKIPGGGYYVALPCQQDDRDPAKAVYRGLGLKLLPRTPTPDDPRRFTIEPFCGGLRFPMGLAVNKAGDLFASDNQGNYNPFNEINHLAPGKRYGFINKLEQRPGFAPPTESPAIEIPHPWTRSVNGLCFLYTPEAVRARTGRDLFGPFEGHLVGCEYNDKSLFRFSLEKIDGTYQGGAYPMTLPPAAGQATFEGPTVCEVAPDGDLYVGNMQDSGWGGGRNTGSIVRLRPSGALPAGIREIRAAADGFTIDFTRPLPRAAAGDRKNYVVESFRRISTPQYGGNDVDRAPAHVRRIDVAADGLSVRLTLDKMKPGFVYEFHLRDLATAGETFFPAEAYYTLKRVPQGAEQAAGDGR